MLLPCGGVMRLPQALLRGLIGLTQKAGCGARPSCPPSPLNRSEMEQGVWRDCAEGTPPQMLLEPAPAMAPAERTHTPSWLKNPRGCSASRTLYRPPFGQNCPSRGRENPCCPPPAFPSWEDKEACCLFPVTAQAKLPKPGPWEATPPQCHDVMVLWRCVPGHNFTPVRFCLDVLMKSKPSIWHRRARWQPPIPYQTWCKPSKKCGSHRSLRPTTFWLHWQFATEFASSL